MGNQQELLDAFILRASFTYGWPNLESWHRRMAEQAIKEIDAKEEQRQQAASRELRLRYPDLTGS